MTVTAGKNHQQQNMGQKGGPQRMISPPPALSSPYLGGVGGTVPFTKGSVELHDGLAKGPSANTASQSISRRAVPQGPPPVAASRMPLREAVYMPERQQAADMEVSQEEHLLQASLDIVAHHISGVFRENKSVKGELQEAEAKVNYLKKQLEIAFRENQIKDEEIELLTAERNLLLRETHHQLHPANKNYSDKYAQTQTELADKLHVRSLVTHNASTNTSSRTNSEDTIATASNGISAFSTTSAYSLGGSGPSVAGDDSTASSSDGRSSPIFSSSFYELQRAPPASPCPPPPPGMETPPPMISETPVAPPPAITLTPPRSGPTKKKVLQIPAEKKIRSSSNTSSSDSAARRRGGAIPAKPLGSHGTIGKSSRSNSDSTSSSYATSSVSTKTSSSGCVEKSSSSSGSSGFGRQKERIHSSVSSDDWQPVEKAKKVKPATDHDDLLTFAEVEAAREIAFLCKKHNVDPRTVDWFLQHENARFLINMASKCKELDRRSTKQDSYVKNPSAWLTRYLNEVKNGTARY